MPRLAVEDNSRMSLRIPAGERKRSFYGRPALRRTDLTDFVRQIQLERRQGSDSGSGTSGTLRAGTACAFWRLLEDPPGRSAKLLAAAKSLPKRK